MNSHHLFLKWLILAVLLSFGLGAAFYFDLVQTILANDISLISAGIMGVFVITSIFLGFRTTRSSKELNLAAKVRDIIQSTDLSKSDYKIDKDDKILVNETELPKCELTDYIRKLILKSQASGTSRIDQRILLENFGDNLHERSEVGWFVAQKMINLGLLGTAIGFAVALTALFGITSFDFAAMKTILSNVAVGMSIALYTTITALTASIPLKIKCYFLERGNNELISIATEVTEIYVIPSLEKKNAKKSSKK